MPNTPAIPSSALAPLLEQALDRAVDSSLSSLESLRDAVGSYTRHEKNRGMSLDSIMRGISSVLMQVEDERASPEDTSPRDPKLARQLRAWCSECYADVG
jgi:hypothetical protein